MKYEAAAAISPVDRIKKEAYRREDNIEPTQLESSIREQEP